MLGRTWVIYLIALIGGIIGVGVEKLVGVVPQGPNGLFSFLLYLGGAAAILILAAGGARNVVSSLKDVIDD